MTTFDHAGLKDLVYKATNRFCHARRLPAQDREDIEADAFLTAVEADISYDPEKGAKRPTWVAFKVEKGLREAARRHARRAKNLPTVSVDLLKGDEPVTDDACPFEAADLLYDLRSDAALVVRLVLDTPLDLWGLVGKRKPKPGVVRKRLAAVLVGMGWPLDRAKKAFMEIREVITNG
jgi:hypothetical protein